jgi:hypothetical protein
LKKKKDIIKYIEFENLNYIIKIFTKLTSLKRFSNDLKEYFLKLIDDSEYDLKVKLIPIYFNGK